MPALVVVVEADGLSHECKLKVQLAGFGGSFCYTPPL